MIVNALGILALTAALIAVAARRLYRAATRPIEDPMHQARWIELPYGKDHAPKPHRSPPSRYKRSLARVIYRALES